MHTPWNHHSVDDDHARSTLFDRSVNCSRSYSLSLSKLFSSTRGNIFGKINVFSGNLILEIEIQIDFSTNSRGMSNNGLFEYCGLCSMLEAKYSDCIVSMFPFIDVIVDTFCAD